MAMTAKQKAFVEEYLVDLNATQAAIRAGYSPATANVIGPENLSKPCIQAAVAEAKRKRSERTEISADFVLKELYGIAKGEADDGNDSHMKFSAKLKALELIGKHIGMFEKQEQKDATIRVVFGDDAEDDWSK